MDFAVPAEHSVKLKESEKIDSCRRTEKAVVMPILISAIDTIPKDFERRLEKLIVNERIETLQIG